MLTIDHIWQGILTLGALFLGWRHNEHRKEIDGMKAEIDANRASIEKHKLYAAETYATETAVVAELDRVEKRLAEQIKQNHEHVLERLDDIRDRLPRRN